MQDILLCCYTITEEFHRGLVSSRVLTTLNVLYLVVILLEVRDALHHLHINFPLMAWPGLTLTCVYMAEHAEWWCARAQGPLRGLHRDHVRQLHYDPRRALSRAPPGGRKAHSGQRMLREWGVGGLRDAAVRTGGCRQLESGNRGVLC